MDSISKVLKSPFYFGEISEEETKNILMKEPPNSYLLRRKTNKTITLAIIFDSLIKNGKKFQEVKHIRNENQISVLSKSRFIQADFYKEAKVLNTSTDKILKEKN